MLTYSDLVIAAGKDLEALGSLAHKVRWESEGAGLQAGGSASPVFTLVACLINITSGPPDPNCCFDTNNPLAGLKPLRPLAAAASGATRALSGWGRGQAHHPVGLQH